MARLDPVEALVREGRWRAAQRAILRALKETPDSHWLLSRLSLTYYEQRDYRSALTHAKRALALSPSCHLALWEYAGALQMLGRHREAIQTYRRLTRRGAKRIATGPCGEGIARARGLVADCHYRLSESLAAVGKRQAALKEFATHLDMRGPGCRSIYPLDTLTLGGLTSA